MPLRDGEITGPAVGIGQLTARPFGTARAVTCSMAEARKERRRTWSEKDRERLRDYERQWRQRPEKIREEWHDQHSVTIRPDGPKKPKR